MYCTTVVYCTEDQSYKTTPLEVQRWTENAPQTDMGTQFYYYWHSLQQNEGTYIPTIMKNYPSLIRVDKVCKRRNV